MDDDASHERQDITNQVHIKCAVCADFELCVDCMSAGATVAPHHADHAYRVMDSLAFPLFAADWSAAEELLLLHAIEINGLGNWTEVRVVWAGRWAAAALARCPGWFGSAAERIQTWFSAVASPRPLRRCVVQQHHSPCPPWSPLECCRWWYVYSMAPWVGAWCRRERGS